MNKKPLENNVGKTETAGGQPFLLFPQSFCPIYGQILSLGSPLTLYLMTNF